MMAAKLPNLDHFTLDHSGLLYEPAEDTFLLCDALLKDKSYFAERKPSIICEIGCGSGCVICYAEQMLRDLGLHPLFLGADINPDAASFTLQTAVLNNLSTEAVLSDLASNLRSNLVDVLIFNPPYVPTPSSEVGSNGIAAAWAGGIDGREVIDRFLPKIDELLAPRGRCYLLLVEENRPLEIAQLLRGFGFAVQLALKKRARNENLCVLSIDKLV